MGQRTYLIVHQARPYLVWGGWRRTHKSRPYLVWVGGDGLINHVPTSHWWLATDS